MASSTTVQSTAVAVALSLMLVLAVALAAPPDVNLVWTDSPATPYAPVTLVRGQSLILNWPGAVCIAVLHTHPLSHVPRDALNVV